MADEFPPPDKQQSLDLTLDSPYESRYELVEKLAHKLWERRGSPIGSPDVDWLAAEKSVYASLVAAGLITPSSNGSQNIEEEIYRRR